MENYVILNGLVPDFNSMSFSKKTVVVKNQIIEDVLEPNSLTTFNNQYKKIDVNGNILSFGFIDVHSHSDLATFSDKNSNPKIKQGVTTEIIGNCGLSVYPYNGFIDWKNRFSSVWGFPEIEWNWSSVSDYIEKTKNRGKNEVFPLIGYGALRSYISGNSSEPYDSSKLKEMSYLIEKSFEEGAIGVSFGIGYIPNIFATEQEYDLVAQLVAKHNKILAVHMRDEGDEVLESFDEIIKYSIKYGTKTEISHLKCHGPANWNKQSLLLQKIESYKDKLELNFDIYPYFAGSTAFSSILPPQYLKMSKTELIGTLKSKNQRAKIWSLIENGINGWENYGKTTNFDRVIPSGYTQSIEEISNLTSKSIIDTVCDLILEHGDSLSMIMKGVKEENLEILLKHPQHMIGSDALFNSNPHPRTYGTYYRWLKEYVNDKKIVSWIDALYKTTALPAKTFSLKNRGEIKKGNIASLISINPEKLTDNATYENPKAFSSGVELLDFYNGNISLFY
ncbi:amidohydrolase family protein [bacterium]|nr:amidohydrolase family protein [bacterium]